MRIWRTRDNSTLNLNLRLEGLSACNRALRDRDIEVGEGSLAGLREPQDPAGNRELEPQVAWVAESDLGAGAEDESQLSRVAREADDGREVRILQRDDCLYGASAPVVR